MMKILIILSIVLLLSTLICGLYIGKLPEVDPSSISFHKTIGIASVTVTVITLIYVMIKIN